MSRFLTTGVIAQSYLKLEIDDFIEATGGSIGYMEENGDIYKVHIFKESDDFVVTEAPTGRQIEYLVVAGGGGANTGGGGGGGLLSGSLTPDITVYNIVIGAGGPGRGQTGWSENGDEDGNDTTAFGLTAIGGGGGFAGDGGSGGGAYRTSGGADGGSGTPGQGNDGGNNASGATDGGGGGGASTAGGVGVAGNGATWTLPASIATSHNVGEVIGSDVWFAGGGGGGAQTGNSPVYEGGNGGGGDSDGGSGGQSALPNSGGGGGGLSTSGTVGGNGGSGVVIIRYLTPEFVDEDAIAFFDAAEITDETQKTAITELVIDLKEADVWDKMIAIYPFVGGTASTHKWNLKDPRDLNDAYRLTFAGGWTHNANGAISNGTNAYAEMYIQPNLFANWSTDASMALYSRTAAQGAYDMGSRFGTGHATGLIIRFADNDGFYNMMPLAGAVRFVENLNGEGFYQIGRNGTVRNWYKNNTKPHTDSDTTSYNPADQNMVLATYRTNGGDLTGYTARNYAFCYVGRVLTDQQAYDYYDAVQKFQTTLGREV